MLIDMPPIPTNFATVSVHQQVAAPTNQLLTDQLQQVVQDNQQQGVRTGLAVSNRQGSLWRHQADEEHFAASVNKVPIIVTLLDYLRAGRIELGTTVVWQPEDRRGGAGQLDQPDAPRTATVRELIRDILHRSGNTAARVVVNNVFGGAAHVNEIWRTRYGLQHTYLVPLEGPGQRFYFGYTNADEALWMFDLLVRRGDTYRDLAVDDMTNNVWDHMGVRSVRGDTITVSLVNKIGYLDDPAGNNRHDVGMVINQRTGAMHTYAFLETAPAQPLAATDQANAGLRQMGVSILRATGDNKAGIIRQVDSPDQTQARKRLFMTHKAL